MKCQILFSVRNKKNITNLSSAELAKRVIVVKKLGYCFGFSFETGKRYLINNAAALSFANHQARLWILI